MALSEKDAAKVDRRVVLTKGLIKEAFLELKKTHSLADIKVTDLCERAGIGRGTFYRHYRNMNEVLDEVLDEALSQSSSLARHLLAMESGKTSACVGCDMPFCQFIRENKHYSGIFMDNTLTDQIVTKAVASQRDHYLHALAGRSDLSPDELDGILYFQASGCLAVVRRTIGKSPREWERIQKTLDAFILAGVKETTR